MSSTSINPNHVAGSRTTSGQSDRIATSDTHSLPIYTRHLIGRYRRSGLFWAIGVSIYTALNVLVFPSFQNTGALDISSYPESMREALNITTLNEIEPYLSTQVLGYLPIILAFFPITILAGAIAGAEERGSLDVLLGTPLPRRNLVLASWLAVAGVLLTMLVLLGASSWLTALAMDVELSAEEAFGAALDLFPISMAFGSLALLVSALVRQRSIAIGIPVVAIFGMYLIDIVGKISPALENLRYVSAFRYYGDAIQEGVPWGGVAVLMIASVVLLIAAIPAFDHRDVFA